MLRALLIGVLISSILLSSSLAVRANVADSKEDLALTAERFLTSWLLKRDEGTALKYVATNPILGSCMTPESLERKKRLSRADIAQVFRKALSWTLVRTREAPTLADALDSTPSVPRSDSNVTFFDHSMPQYFQIFRLKPTADPSDIAYICKFDERQSFRAAVARPSVYYLFAKVRGKASRPALRVETLWVKEKGRWRILTMSIDEEQ
jgi:hypothetical protein